MPEITKLLSKYKYFILSCIVLTITISGLFAYIQIDNTPPHWDAGRHFANSVRYFEYAKNSVITNKPNGNTDAIANLLHGYFYYPPLYYYSTVPFLAIFGRGYDAALLVNIFWIIVLFISCYSWLKKLKFSEYSIFFGLSFLLGSSFIIGQSREYQLDFPNLAMIFTLLLSLEKITHKQNYLNLFFVSFVLAVGPLIKWHFILYTIPILLIYFIHWLFINNLKISKEKLTYFIFATYVCQPLTI